MVEKGEFKNRLFGIGRGQLTSFEISFNLSQADKNPEWAEKGLLTRNYSAVRWNRKEDIQKVIDEAKKELDIGKLLDHLGALNGLIDLNKRNGIFNDPLVNDILAKLIIEAKKLRDNLVNWFGAEASLDSK